MLTTTSNSYISAVKTFDNKFVSVANDASLGSFQIVAVKVNSDLEYDSIYTQPYTYDSLCPHPIVSDTVDPSCENVYVSIDEPFKKPETTKLKIYPNPTDKNVTVGLPNYLVVNNNRGHIPTTTVYHQWASATLQVLDIKGVTIIQQEVESTQQPIHMNLSHMPAGMYLFRLVYKGSVVADCKLVVR